MVILLKTRRRVKGHQLVTIGTMDTSGSISLPGNQISGSDPKFETSRRTPLFPAL